MATNPFKSFVPFEVKPQSFSEHTVGTYDGTKDPSGGQWRTFGFVPPIKGDDMILKLNGVRLLCVQFNERVLPSKVRDEHLAKAVDKLEKMTGHKITKKDYAQLRDQVEFDLLPKAFIRRSRVMVAMYDSTMLIFTSSQKRADDIASLMYAAFSSDLEPAQMSTAESLSGVLTQLAKDGQLFCYADGDLYEDTGKPEFYSSSNAVLKANGKKTIRIKGVAIEEGDIQTLLTQGYVVDEIGLKCDDDQAPTMEFTVTSNLVFKRIEVLADSGNGNKEGQEDFYGSAVIYIEACKLALKNLVHACGGIAERVTAEYITQDGEIQEDFIDYEEI